MEKLQVINHPKFGTLTVIVIDGKEMFKANECAAMLGYAHPKDAISRHCKGAMFHRLPTSSGMQDVKFIPEGDLWRLIIRSKLPQAEEIEKWIMEEVLPTIRKTGRYNVAEAPQGKQLCLDEKPYEYYDKTWNGEPLLTTEDVEHLASIDRSMVCYYLRKSSFVENTDYYHLRGINLEQFKGQNPKLPKNINHLILITKTGFQKLCTYAGVEFMQPQCFIEQKAEPKRRLIQLPSKAMKSLMGYIQEETKAIDAIAYLLLTNDTKENHEAYRSSMLEHLKRIKGFCLDVKSVII